MAQQEQQQTEPLLPKLRVRKRQTIRARLHGGSAHRSYTANGGSILRMAHQHLSIYSRRERQIPEDIKRISDENGGSSGMRKTETKHGSESEVSPKTGSGSLTQRKQGETGKQGSECTFRAWIFVMRFGSKRGANGVRFTYSSLNCGVAAGSKRGQVHLQSFSKRGQVHLQSFELRRGGRCAGQMPAKRRVLASTIARKKGVRDNF